MRKTIVITGSTQGLGLLLGIYLLKKGNYVIFNYGHNDKQANVAKKIIKKATNRNFEMIKADLSNYRETIEFFNILKKNIENVDILINNIGIARNGNILFLKNDLWTETINTNLNSVYYCTKYFSKIKKNSKDKTKIINIGSYLALTGKINNLAYSTTKSALIGFTRTIALDLEMFNIESYLIFPPSIRTNLNRTGQYDRLVVNKYCSFINDLCNDEHKFPSGSIINLNDKYREVYGHVYTLFDEETMGK